MKPVPPPTPEQIEQVARQEWQDLLEKDDRTSPEEYPEMALITFEELRDAMSRVRPPRDPQPQDEERADEQYILGIISDDVVSRIDYDDLLKLVSRIRTALASLRSELGNAHASAPEGLRCANCTIDGETCPYCYEAAWRKRHPNTVFVDKFTGHLQAVQEFLSELYCTMVDPLADGTISVAEMKAALLKAAKEQRERLGSELGDAQRIRADAMEEAAKVAEHYRPQINDNPLVAASRETATRIAAAIRSAVSNPKESKS